ncbi:MAG: hypothetical protein AAFX52_15955 [Pseudomonadota bacterium]
MMLRLCVSVLACAWSFAAAAEPLTAGNIERFIAVGETLEALDERYPDIDIDMPEENPQELLETLIDDKGQLHLFAVISKELAAHPQAGGDFQKAVRDEGFSSTSEFGHLGDRITTTMFALNFSKSDLESLRQIGNLPEEVRSALPKDVRDMMQRAQLFAESIDEVSEADKEILRPYQDKIEGLGGDFGG